MNDAYVASNDYTGLISEEEIRVCLDAAMNPMIEGGTTGGGSVAAASVLPGQQEQQQQQQNYAGGGGDVGNSGVNDAIDAALVEEGNSMTLEDAMGLVDTYMQ